MINTNVPLYRRIIQTEIPSMQRTSRGIILICIPTQRVLCVERRNTPEFLHFMRGFYRKDNIRRDIIPCCDKGEHDLLKSICDEPDKKSRKAKIADFLKSRYSIDKVMKCIDIASDNFEEDLEEIRSCLDQILPRDQKNWMFPKGGLNRGESELECALRELKEESTVNLSPELVSNKQLNIEFTSFFGVTFRTQYYVAYTQVEFTLTKDFDTKEISDVKWIDLDKLEEYITIEYTKLIPAIRECR